MAPPSKWAEVIQKASQADRPERKGEPGPAADATALAKAAAVMASTRVSAGRRGAGARTGASVGSTDALALRVRQALASPSAPAPAARGAGSSFRVQNAADPAPAAVTDPPSPAQPAPAAPVPPVASPSAHTLGWLARVRRWLGFERRD
jgi:hypothetical protein